MERLHTHALDEFERAANLINIACEPLQLHARVSGQDASGRAAICVMPPTGRKHWCQQLVDVDELDAKLARLQVEQRPDSGYYVSQNTLRPDARGRRVNDVWRLNAFWLDVDLLHPPATFDLGQLPFGDGLAARLIADPESVADLLAEHIAELGLPPPTAAIYTGQGLCLKWVFTASLPAGRHRREWDKCMQSLISMIAAYNFGTGEAPRRWPIDRSAGDASRVLRIIGTMNPASGTRCAILRAGARVDFEEFAESLLHAVPAPTPTKSPRQRSKTPTAEAAAAAAGDAIAVAHSSARAHALWTRRLSFGLAIVRARGGARPGQRNDVFWLLALAVAWTSRSLDELRARLVQLRHDVLPPGGAQDWAIEDAEASASAVIKRFPLPRGGIGGGVGLYVRTSRWFVARLERALGKITDDEHERYDKLLFGRTPHPNERACGYETILNVAECERPAALRARRKGSAYRTQQIRHDKKVHQHAAAAALAAEGNSAAEIGRALGVQARTVKDWLAKPPQRPQVRVEPGTEAYLHLRPEKRLEDDLARLLQDSCGNQLPPEAVLERVDAERQARRADNDAREAREEAASRERIGARLARIASLIKSRRAAEEGGDER